MKEPMNTKKLNKALPDKEIIINSGERLTIETIADFAQRIRNGFAEASTVVIKFKEGVEMDITALQVFCSACRTASTEGKQFLRRGPIPTFLQELITATGSENSEQCKARGTSCFRQLGESQK